MLFKLYKKYTSFRYIKKNLVQLKYILSIEKKSVLFGCDIYSNFIEDININEGDNKNNILKIPNKKDTVIGSHALLLIGFDENNGFIVSNSWKCGDNGVHFISFNYVMSKLCFDFMTLI